MSIVKILKEIFLYAIIFLPFVVLLYVLEFYLGDTWWPGIIVSALMIVSRIGLYLYRRAKGIRGTWLNPWHRPEPNITNEITAMNFQRLTP